MRVTIETIAKMFHELETGAESREFVAEFAANAMRASDVGELIMEPTFETPRIWKAIVYLSGVDLRESPDTYLHCVEDFVSYRKLHGIGIPS